MTLETGPGKHFIIARPVAILMVFLAAVVFGYLSLGRLPVTLMPELTYPTLTVRTVYPGAAPEEVENDIGRPIEEALGVVGGLQTISSINRAGVSDVVLEFTWDVEMSDATQDVLEKLDRVFLPVEAERPLILHFDPSLDPIVELSLAGDGVRYEGEEGLRRLRRLAEQQVKRELEPVKGVAAVQVRGGLEEEIHVALDAATLRRTGISIQAVIDRLAQENINVAGGTLLEGRIEYMVRTLNEFENLDQIEDTIVATFEGRPVRIRDLGEVSWNHKEREILTRTDGNESVQIDIFKEADANIVAVADRVRRVLGEFDLEKARAGETAVVAKAGRGGPDGGSGMAATGLNQALYDSEGAFMKVVADRSRFIESSISDVKNTAIFGGFLAIAVLYLFLRNFKSTAIVAVSIPVSLLIAFAPLNSMGITLNIMSLGGLALGIGMLVDSSIVVLESIYRCKEEGDSMTQAVIRGTLEVRSAVVASTLTSVAVFFPMVFVEGIAGQAFGDLGFAVVFSLLASAGVALFFIPMVANRTGLGLGTTGVVAAVLGIGALTTRFPQAGGIVGGLFALCLIAGWATVAVLAIRGRLANDPATKKTTGLWRWSSLAALRKGFPGYRRAVANQLALPFRRTRLNRALAWLLWPLSLIAGLLFGILGLLYLGVARFLVGSVLEWVVGKPVLFAVMGFAALTRSVLAPAVAVAFRVVTWAPARGVGAVMGVANRTYPRILRGALAHPGIVVIVMAVCIWFAWDAGTSLDSELLPEVHQGEFTVEVQLPVGTPLAETDRVTRPVEQAILAEREHIDSLILTVGYDSANSARSDEGEHSARFKVVLDEQARAADIEEAVVERLRTRFEGIPDLEARVVRPVLFSSKTPIEVEIYGTDLDLLREYGAMAKAELERLPELADVETTLRPGAPEVQIIYDRDKLVLYDLNISTVARHVRDKVKGFEATRFNLTDRRIPVLVRLKMDDRETVEDVANLIVNPGGDRPIRLGSVADVTLGEGPSEVRRVEGSRVALIQANLSQGSLSAAAGSIRETLHDRIDWPAQLGFDIRGQSEEWERSQRSLVLALALSLFLVYVIMAVQFESLVHPLVIMLTIPLAFVGTFLALKLLSLNLSVVVFLGMIMLAGIVVNNAIVLIDYINTLRARNVEKLEAIVTAGSVRLRPILMTTATTVLGLIPLALGVGDGAELRAPMAIAVISGLITSTALTLIVIPTIYSLLDGLVAWIAGARTRKGAAPVGPLVAGADIDSVRP